MRIKERVSELYHQESDREEWDRSGYRAIMVREAGDYGARGEGAARALLLTA